MYDTLVEMTLEFGLVAGRFLGALGAAVAGVLLEMNSLQTLGTGDQTVGVWMAVLGIVFLAVGYVLAGDAARAFSRRAGS